MTVGYTYIASFYEPLIMQAFCEVYHLLTLRGFRVCKRELVTPYIFRGSFWLSDTDWFTNYWCSVY